MSTAYDVIFSYRNTHARITIELLHVNSKGANPYFQVQLKDHAGHVEGWQDCPSWNEAYDLWSAKVQESSTPVGLLFTAEGHRRY